MLLFFAEAQAFTGYYGHFLPSSTTLKEDLYFILSSNHTPTHSGPDIIEPQCQGLNCYSYKPMTYTKARQHLFGRLHLFGETPEPYTLTDSYCNEVYTNLDLDSAAPLGPLKIPDTKILNTEHVWPQSKFSKQFSENDQKPNLHILLPVNSRVNSTRSNHPMGWVVTATSTPCTEASLGKSSFNQTVFEPSDSIKGDVARSLFYFSVRFRLTIDSYQEEALRAWHQMDPPSEFEIWRNEEIFALQLDRNPFIDMPELVDNISDF